MNRPDVRKALNIPNHVDPWTECVRINYKYTINNVTQINASQWIYESLNGKYKMLKISGDVDLCVPTVGTKNWIKDAGFKVD